MAWLAGPDRRLLIDLGCESGQDCQGRAPGKRDPELAIGEPSVEASGGLESGFATTRRSRRGVRLRVAESRGRAWLASQLACNRDENFVVSVLTGERGVGILAPLGEQPDLVGGMGCGLVYPEIATRQRGRLSGKGSMGKKPQMLLHSESVQLGCPGAECGVIRQIPGVERTAGGSLVVRLKQSWAS